MPGIPGGIPPGGTDPGGIPGGIPGAGPGGGPAREIFFAFFDFSLNLLFFHFCLQVFKNALVLAKKLQFRGYIFSGQIVLY